MPVAIVTGASKGLGKALAAGLACRGWSLVVDARTPADLEDAATDLLSLAVDGAAVVPIAGDVTDARHREALVAAAAGLGGLDLLVNNASTLGRSPLPHLEAYPIDELAHVFEVNVIAPLALVQAAMPLLRAALRPRVLDITSDASVEHYEGWGGYGASKAALDHLSATLAAEEPGLTVWAADPGDLRTDMHQEAFPGEDISDRPPPESAVPALIALIEGETPSGRVRAADLATATAER
jgi:NAD(P)-dependent dehydrogenase (short-subunit alcohol dehydrogenase family)